MNAKSKFLTPKTVSVNTDQPLSMNVTNMNRLIRLSSMIYVTIAMANKIYPNMIY